MLFEDTFGFLLNVIKIVGTSRKAASNNITPAEEISKSVLFKILFKLF